VAPRGFSPGFITSAALIAAFVELSYSELLLIMGLVGPLQKLTWRKAKDRTPKLYVKRLAKAPPAPV
jgi:hypothetical protein